MEIRASWSYLGMRAQVAVNPSRTGFFAPMPRKWIILFHVTAEILCVGPDPAIDLRYA
jgi:hypothetical protein